MRALPRAVAPAVLTVLALGCSSSDGPKLNGTLTFNDVALFQTVRASLMQPASPKVPVIANKDAMVRAYLAPTGEVVGRTLRVSFRVSSGGKEQSFDSEAVANATASDAAPAGLSLATISADALRVGSKLAVDVHDSLTGEKLASWPGNNTFYDLGATDAQDKLRITLVPVQYNADNSGRLPDTSEAMLKDLEATLLAMYPVAAVEFQMHEPIASTGAVSRNGSGWSTLLDRIATLRQNDKVDRDVYYVGMVSPAASKQAFCQNACVAGLSFRSSSASDDTSRASLILGYQGSSTASTLAHELGHAHGREHAPCDVSDADKDFPYDDGGIGVWGFDRRSQKVLSPEKTKDMMSYCEPEWVSDYTYNALHERMLKVKALPARRTAADVEVEALSVQADGSFAKLGKMRIDSAVLTEQMEVSDRTGRVAGSVSAKRYEHSDGESSLVLVRVLPIGAMRVTFKQ